MATILAEIYLSIATIRATTGLILKYTVTNISIQAHLLDFLRRKDLDAAYTVHKLPEIPQTRQHKQA